MKLDLLQSVVRLYVRHELPGWGWCDGRFVGDYRWDARWSGMPARVIRGKLHGYEMELNLGAWSERKTFFLSRFYELGTQLLLIEALRTGDRFVDFGGNIGMLTLLASSRVGPDGRVDTVEPNPACADRIRAAISRNAITNIVVHGVAAGDKEGVATLTIPEWNAGEASLSSLAPQHGRGVQAIQVPVVLADSIVTNDPRPAAVIKIDVEGFEVSILRGLKATLARDHPLVITEVDQTHLARAGTSADSLFKLMREAGFMAYSVSTQRRLLRHKLFLEPCDRHRHADNVAWVFPGSEMASRLDAVLAVSAAATGSKQGQQLV